MEDSVRENIFLSLAEFYALIKSRDIRDIVVFDEAVMKVPDERTVVLALAGLTGRGLLKSSDGELVMGEQLRKFTDVLKNTDYSISLRFFKDLRPMQCVYLNGSDAVILEMDETRSGYIRVRNTEFSTFMDEFSEYDFIPRGSCVGRGADSGNVNRIVQEFEKTGEMGNDDILLAIRRFSGKRDASGEREVLDLILIRDALSDVFSVITRNDKKSIMYSKDRLYVFFELLKDKTDKEIMAYDFG